MSCNICPFGDEFHSTVPYVYLDSAGRSISPVTVESTGIACVQSKSKPWLGLADAADEVRDAFANLVRADSKSISFSPCTSYSISLAAHNISLANKLTNNDKILVLANEMSSAVYPWQYLCEKSTSTIHVVQRPEEGSNIDWTALIVESITANVAVVAVPNVHWCDGALLNLRLINDKVLQLREASNSSRPYLVVDATQSIGVLPIHVDNSDELYSYSAIDFLACSVHKWLCGPYGVSLMYVHPKHHSQWVPLSFHERNHVGSADIHRWDEVGVMNNSTGYFPTTLPEHAAERLDIGGRPNPILLPMVRVALECVRRWNTPSEGSILPREYCRYLTNQIEESLHAFIEQGLIGVTPKDRRCDHIIGIQLTHPLLVATELVQYLKVHHILVSIRCSYIRISPYIYNSLSDIITLCNCICDYIRSKCI